MMYTKDKLPSLEETLASLWPSEPRVTGELDIGAVKATHGVEARLSQVESVLFEVWSLLYERGIVSDKGFFFKGVPVGLTLYSTPIKGNPSRKTLLVTPSGFQTQTGVISNSLGDALNLCSFEAMNPFAFWRLGGHDGPSLEEVYGYRLR